MFLLIGEDGSLYQADEITASMRDSVENGILDVVRFNPDTEKYEQADENMEFSEVESAAGIFVDEPGQVEEPNDDPPTEVEEPEDVSTSEEERIHAGQREI